MRRALARLTIAAVLVGAAQLAAPVAVAKGPSHATIEGAGRAVSVGWETAGGRRGTMADLLDVTSFWNVADARPVAEPARKGPAYVVRYVLGPTEEFRQVLYPASSAGSVVYTPGAQRRYGELVPENWAEAPVNLSLFLRSYGIDVPVAPAPVELNDNRRPGWWPAAGLVVLMLLGVVSSLRRRWTCRRRR